MDASSPLSEEQQTELRDAQERAASILGATKVATFNGWTLGVFAAISVLFGLVSLTGLLVGIGLGIVARNEFVGRGRLRALDPAGLELLWRNQLGLMALIVVYCLWSMYRTVAFPDPQLAELTELMGEGTGELVRSLTLTVYGAVIVATGLFQGLNARYYYVRVARLHDFLAGTPAWVLDLQRTMAPGPGR